MSLKPYPQYKASGVAGSEYIPGDWDIVRNKYFLKERNVPSQDGTEELLTVSQYTGITKRRDRLTEKSDLLTTSKTLEGYKTVIKEDMVMNIMLAWNGSLGVSQLDGIVSPAYCVFNVNKKLIVPKYLHYLHRTKLYTGVFEAASTGVIKSRLRLYPDKYLALKSIMPPLTEQDQIVRYLDWKTSQVNRFIKAKKRQIELLKELKQVIINDAVTGKIDIRTGKPYPKYKDSGVEWLGMVPEEWTITKLKFLSSKIGDGIHTTPDYIDESDIHFINGNNLSDGTIVFTAQTKCVDHVQYEKHRIDFKLGTLLLSINGTIGNVAFFNDEKIILGKSAAYIEIIDPLLNGFVYLFIQGNPIKNYFRASFNGTTINNLSLFTLRNTPILIPQYSEIESIVQYVKNRTVRIDALISKCSIEIQHLQDYRSRLMADVVTGKIDVRNIIVPEFDIENGIEDTTEEIEDIEEEIVANE